MDDVARKPEQFAAASLDWAKLNAVRSKTSKTEAILFSRRRKHRRCQRGIRVGKQDLRAGDGAVFWRLRAASGVRPGEAVEPQVWSRGREFRGKYNILPGAVAVEQARSERAKGTIWTDGPRLEERRWKSRSGVLSADDRGVGREALLPG